MCCCWEWCLKTMMFLSSWQKRACKKNCDRQQNEKYILKWRQWKWKKTKENPERVKLLGWVVFHVKYLLMAFFLISSSSSLNHRLLVVVCVVNCKSLQVATYRHVSTLKRIWTMKNDFRTYTTTAMEREMMAWKKETTLNQTQCSENKAHNWKTISFLLSFAFLYLTFLLVLFMLCELPSSSLALFGKYHESKHHVLFLLCLAAVCLLIKFSFIFLASKNRLLALINF